MALFSRIATLDYPLNKTPLIPNSCVCNDSVCRICLSNDAQEDLISPCKCIGTAEFVHKECLDQWMAVSKRSNTCGICGEHYVTPWRNVFTFGRWLRMNEQATSSISMLIVFACVGAMWRTFGVSAGWHMGHLTNPMTAKGRYSEFCYSILILIAEAFVEGGVLVGAVGQLSAKSDALPMSRLLLLYGPLSALLVSGSVAPFQTFKDFNIVVNAIGKFLIRKRLLVGFAEGMKWMSKLQHIGWNADEPKMKG
ncbi:hypothetical protein BDR26DRAFT_360907 [Obelidium mucronatum]|nr:hypothetical protein BDR26DRAFT_360907 [Obelidium mucronatum]